jgi:hypothetical protein
MSTRPKLLPYRTLTLAFIRFGSFSFETKWNSFSKVEPPEQSEGGWSNAEQHPTNYQPPATNYQLPAIPYQPAAEI